MGVTKEAIKNFLEEKAINFFNNFNAPSFSNSQGTFNANHCTFNPLDKPMEIVEKNKKLYERLLEAEKEKTAYAERLIKK